MFPGFLYQWGCSYQGDGMWESVSWWPLEAYGMASFSFLAYSNLRFLDSNLNSFEHQYSSWSP